MGQRRRARESAFHIAFSQHFTGYGRHLAVERALQIDEGRSVSGDELTERLLAHLEDHRSEVEDCLAKSLTNWTVERLANVDAAILRLGVAELLYEPEIPAASTINEWVELAHRYGEDKSPGFVNAVLDRVRKERCGGR